MNLVRSTSKIFFVKITNAVLGFVAIAYFARVLGSAELGIFFLFQAVHGILSIPADFGINNATKKRLSEGSNQATILGTAASAKLFSVGVISVVILLTSDYINSYLGAEWTMYLIIAILIHQYAQLFISVLHGELRVGETAIIKFARQIVWVISGVLFLSMGYEAVGLVYAYITGEIVIISWSLYRIKTPFGWPKLEQARSVFDYSRFSFISSIGGYAYSWVDVFIIGFFLSSSHVAAYEVAWRITAIVVLFSSAIATTIFPQVSSWDSEDATEKIQELLGPAVTASVILAIPAFFGSIVLSTEILELIFGPEFVMASVALIVLMGEKVFQSAHKILGYSLQAIDRPDLAAYIALGTIVVNILLNLALIPILGITGAALATGASFVLNTFLHAGFLYRYVCFGIEYKKIVWCFASSAAMMSVLLFSKLYMSVESIILLFGYVTVGAILYFMILLLYQPLRGDLKRLSKSF